MHGPGRFYRCGKTAIAIAGLISSVRFDQIPQEDREAVLTGLFKSGDPAGQTDIQSLKLNVGLEGHSAGTAPPAGTPRFARFSPSINIAGVTTSVRIVATTNPPAMAEDSSVHHCVDGAP